MLNVIQNEREIPNKADKEKVKIVVQIYNPGCYNPGQSGTVDFITTR